MEQYGRTRTNRKNKTMMYYIRLISRILMGILFIMSGYVKMVDPYGFALKIGEIFNSFGLGFMEPASMVFAFLGILAEFAIGWALLLGIQMRLTAWGIMLFMSFFTLLTFWFAYGMKIIELTNQLFSTNIQIKQAVTDCGCFGDAVKLEPWTSFWKDIVLLVMILIILFGIGYIRPVFPKKFNYFLLSISLLVCCGIAYWGIAHLPIVDFRPYAVGKNLKQGMEDGSSEVKKIDYILKNLKDNKEKTMSLDEYMNSGIWEDTLNWKIVKTDEKIIKKGVPSSVHDFNADCGADGDQTKSLLDEEKIAVFTVPFADRLSTVDMAKLRKITSEFAQRQIKFVILASDPKVLALSSLKACSTDPTTLKTINRSNPGLMILKKSVVVAKYNVNDFPDYKEINKL